MEKKATGDAPNNEKKMITMIHWKNESPNTVTPKAPKENVAMTKLAESHMEAAFQMEQSVFSSSSTKSTPFVSALSLEAHLSKTLSDVSWASAWPESSKDFSNESTELFLRPTSFSSSIAMGR